MSRSQVCAVADDAATAYASAVNCLLHAGPAGEPGAGLDGFYAQVLIEQFDGDHVRLAAAAELLRAENGGTTLLRWWLVTLPAAVARSTGWTGGVIWTVARSRRTVRRTRARAIVLCDRAFQLVLAAQADADDHARRRLVAGARQIMMTSAPVVTLPDPDPTDLMDALLTIEGDPETGSPGQTLVG